MLIKHASKKEKWEAEACGQLKKIKEKRGGGYYGPAGLATDG